jgi:branched-chain amino acid transport system substrate-binding protein
VRLTRVVAVVSLALLPFSGTACGPGAASADSGPIVIGADLELTGVDSAIGTTYQRALQLRIDEINAAGGVAGRRLSLLAKDNHSVPGISVANVSSFAADRTVAAVVMGACSSCVNSVAKVISDARLPTVSLAPASGTVRPVTDRRYVFKLGPDAEQSAASLATRLHSTGAKKVALLSTDDLNGSDAVTALNAALGKGSPTVVGSQLFPAGDTDPDTAVHAALKNGPDALLVSAFPDQAALVAKSARDAGYTKQILFGATAAGNLFLSGPAAGATNGTVMVAPQSMLLGDVVATNPARIAGKQWFADYTARYGTFSGYSTYAADALRLITDAIAKAGGPEHAKMRDAMERDTFDGYSGQIAFSADNHSGLRPAALTMVVARSGRWQPLD